MKSRFSQKIRNFFARFKKRQRPNVRVVQFAKAPIHRERVHAPKRSIIRDVRKIQIHLILACIFFALLILFFSPMLRIQHIEVVRKNLSIDTTKIEQFLTERAIGKHIFFLSSSDLEKQTHNAFPQWKSLIIHKSFPNRLSVDVENFESFAYVVLKTEQVKMVKNEKGNKVPTDEKITVEQKYVLNQQGSISYPEIDSNPSLLILYKDPFTKNIDIGRNIIPTQDVKSIQTVVSVLLHEYDLATKEVEYFKLAKEIHVNVFQFSLWIDLQQNLEEQLKKYNESLQHLDKNKLEYLDLRISNRVIYKEKKD